MYWNRITWDRMFIWIINLLSYSRALWCLIELIFSCSANRDIATFRKFGLSASLSIHQFFGIWRPSIFSSPLIDLNLYEINRNLDNLDSKNVSTSSILKYYKLTVSLIFFNFPFLVFLRLDQWAMRDRQAIDCLEIHFWHIFWHRRAYKQWFCSELPL